MHQQVSVSWLLHLDVDSIIIDQVCLKTEIGTATFTYLPNIQIFINILSQKATPVLVSVLLILHAEDTCLSGHSSCSLKNMKADEGIVLICTLLKMLSNFYRLLVLMLAKLEVYNTLALRSILFSLLCINHLPIYH